MAGTRGKGPGSSMEHQSPEPHVAAAARAGASPAARYTVPRIGALDPKPGRLTQSHGFWAQGAHGREATLSATSSTMADYGKGQGLGSSRDHTPRPGWPWLCAVSTLHCDCALGILDPLQGHQAAALSLRGSWNTEHLGRGWGPHGAGGVRTVAWCSALGNRRIVGPGPLPQVRTRGPPPGENIRPGTFCLCCGLRDTRPPKLAPSPQALGVGQRLSGTG